MLQFEEKTDYLNAHLKAPHTRALTPDPSWTLDPAPVNAVLFSLVRVTGSVRLSVPSKA